MQKGEPQNGISITGISNYNAWFIINDQSATPYCFFRYMALKNNGNANVIQGFTYQQEPLENILGIRL